MARDSNKDILDCVNSKDPNVYIDAIRVQSPHPKRHIHMIGERCEVM